MYVWHTATARVATGQARRLHNGVSICYEPDRCLSSQYWALRYVEGVVLSPRQKICSRHFEGLVSLKMEPGLGWIFVDGETEGRKTHHYGQNRHHLPESQPKFPVFSPGTNFLSGREREQFDVVHWRKVRKVDRKAGQARRYGKVRTCRPYNRGSIGSLSNASTPKMHSCTRRRGSRCTKRSNASIPSANSRCASARFALRPRFRKRLRFSGTSYSGP